MVTAMEVIKAHVIPAGTEIPAAPCSSVAAPLPSLAVVGERRSVPLVGAVPEARDGEAALSSAGFVELPGPSGMHQTPLTSAAHPAGHDAHVPMDVAAAAGENFPGGHRLQLSSDPATALYVPAAQGAHAVVTASPLETEVVVVLAAGITK